MKEYHDSRSEHFESRKRKLTYFLQEVKKKTLYTRIYENGVGGSTELVFKIKFLVIEFL